MANWFSDNELLIQSALAATLLAYSFQLAMRSGVFSMAGVGFWGIGGYTTAILVVDHEWATAPAIAVGCLFSAAIGLALTLILGRLRALYLAMATFAFVLLVQIAVLNWPDVTGGPAGIFGIPVTIGTGTLTAVVAAVSLLMIFFERGKRGRRIEVMRQDEKLAVNVGINVVRERHVIFVLSSVLGALSGGISAVMFNTLTPETIGFAFITDVLMMVVIGGLASWWGAIAGAFIVTWLPEILRFAGEYRGILEGIIVVLVVVYAPQGIVGLVRRLRGLVLRRRPPTVNPVAVEPAAAGPGEDNRPRESTLPGVTPPEGIKR